MDFKPTISMADQEAWILGGELAGVAFRMLQSVDVIAGPDAGENGILISIYAITPEPTYHLETSNGADFIVTQSQIRADVSR